MSSEMAEEFDQLQSTHAIQLSKISASQGPTNEALVADILVPEKEGFPKDIEKTANVHFQVALPRNDTFGIFPHFSLLSRVSTWDK